jgi:transcriptional regulator
MKEAIIKEIVEKVFQKAKTECPKHSRYALSNHIAETTSISSRTIERLYDKYLEKKR